MRETQVLVSSLIKESRITPAYAGNTIASYFSLGLLLDHPRVCGKHYFECAGEPKSIGSPPRMRETLLLFAVFFIAIRDHPRVCGKHLKNK